MTARLRLGCLVWAALLLAMTFQGVLPSAGAAVVTPAFRVAAAPGVSAQLNAGEPSIGLDPATGALLYQAGVSTMRIDLSSWPPTWTGVTSTYSRFNIDPILATDSATGRTWAGGLDGGCSVLSYTDNDGTDWSPTGNSCAVPSWDHETIGSGPYAGSTPVGATYSRILYYCAQESEAQCSTSTNGGLTFGPGTLLACGSLQGHVKVASDGTAYVPNRNCGSHPGFSVSTNNGMSWSQANVPNGSVPGSGFDPSVAVTTHNWAYLAWQNGNNHPYVALTKNRGGSWLNVTDLSTTYTPNIVTSTFQAAVAGDDNRAAVAYLGSSTGGNPFAAGWNGVWDLYVSTTTNGGGTWTTVKVTDDPVQRGWICSAGISCNSGRNLLDFMDATKDAAGHVIVGFADGCVGACATGSGASTSAVPTIAVQSGGSPLYAANDPAAASAPAAPVLSGAAGNSSNSLSWTEPASNGGAITGYSVWRGTTSGGETLLASIGRNTSYVDKGAINGNTYYYEVKAINGVGTGSASNEVTLAPPQLVPTAPTNVQTVGAPAHTFIAVSWNAPTNGGGSAVTNYTVYRSTVSGAETVLAVLGNVTSYTDNDVSALTTYYYYVTATNGYGEGNPSVEVARTA
ncbi:MAG: hypothetical protein QOE90_251 [Thermoplasmata archaeon]|jgi:hypothetical protein|nr:hypothetical protein [Thermoplasmata archaeon]